MPDRKRDPAAVKRAALVYALRSGWTESERKLDLSEAEEMVTELLDAYDGHVDDDLTGSYGDEFAAALTKEDSP